MGPLFYSNHLETHSFHAQQILSYIPEEGCIDRLQDRWQWQPFWQGEGYRLNNHRGSDGKTRRDLHIASAVCVKVTSTLLTLGDNEL